MVKNPLLESEEGSSGLYYSFLIISIVIFSVLFSMLIAMVGETANLASKDWYIFLSFSVSPIAITAATLILVYLKGDSLFSVCGFEKCENKYYLIALVAFVAMLFGLGNLNTIFVEFLSKKLGYKPTQMTLPKFSAINYALVILTVCVLPAITEEVAMRGIVLKGIKSGNVIVNAVIGGLLFSLFHMSPMQTPYQFAVGFVFSLIAIKSGSMLPTIIAHFLNNFAIVTVEYFSPTIFADLDIWTYALIIPAIIGLVIVVAMLLKDGKNKEQANKDCLKNFFMGAIAGIFVCAFMWTMSLLG